MDSRLSGRNHSARYDFLRKEAGRHSINMRELRQTVLVIRKHKHQDLRQPQSLHLFLQPKKWEVVQESRLIRRLRHQAHIVWQAGRRSRRNKNRGLCRLLIYPLHGIFRTHIWLRATGYQISFRVPHQGSVLRLSQRSGLLLYLPQIE